MAAWPSRPSAPGTAWVVALLALAAGLYAIRPPLSPDLAAQVARAKAAELTGDGQWWTGWFGGLALPSYSALSPALMAAAGAPVTGAVASAVALVAAWFLLRRTRRPTLGLLTFGVFDVGNLLVGRVTFAVGMALGLLALAALMAAHRRWHAVGTAFLAGACCLASPLAGLFTGIVAVAVMLTDRRRRATATGVAAVLLACALMLSVLYPSVGTMPTAVVDILPATGASIAVAWLCRPPVVRATAVLSVGATLVFLVAPGGVGENMTRLAWLGATTVLVACGTVPRGLPGVRRPLPHGLLVTLTAAVTAASAVAPLVDVVHQVHVSRDPSTSAAFYRPLVRQLEADRAVLPGAAGTRVEVLDPRTHWASVYVADRVPLARGWDRQADAAYNPLFYDAGALDVDSYTAWLRSMAVGWVAVPHVPLDYASQEESRLIARGVPGVRVIWGNRDWTLYRVVDASPLVEGANLISVDPSGVTVDVEVPAVVHVRVRWDPALVATPVDAVAAGEVPPLPSSAAAATGWPAVQAALAAGTTGATGTTGTTGTTGSVPLTCAAPAADGMVDITLPAGRWRLAHDRTDNLATRWTGACAEVSSTASSGARDRDAEG